MRGVTYFLAIDFDEETKDKLGYLHRHIDGARWVDEEQLHLTLHYFGELSPTDLRVLVSECESLSLSPFDLNLEGVGYFPPRGIPRVLWAGAKLSDPLAHLRKKIESIVHRHKFVLDRKKYIPHITLARLKGDCSEEVGEFLSSFYDFKMPTLRVDNFCLFSSEPINGGRYYEVLETFELTQGREFEFEQ